MKQNPLRQYDQGWKQINEPKDKDVTDLINWLFAAGLTLLVVIVTHWISVMELVK